MYATLYDAGTIATRVPYRDVPGMDELYYREGDLEENIGENKSAVISAIMRDADRIDLEPWPAPFPNHAWVDFTSRYEADGNTGLRLELYSVDSLAGNSHPAPAGEARFTRTPQSLLDPGSGRIQRTLEWREVQERGGPDWRRLDTKNEAGGTRLKAPLALNFGRLRGPGFRLALPDNSLFTPFDFRYPERYIVTDDAGQVLTGDHWLDLARRGHYRLYLRPRRWRYIAVVLVHYWHVSLFESFVAQEYFIRSHYDRPPFYEYRHDINTTAGIGGLYNYFGEPRSYDNGIDHQWNHSRNAAALRSEIIEGQIWSMCYAKIFAGNEPADMSVYRIAPRKGDTILGIGRVDQVTGSEERIWVHQAVEGSEWYPDTILGQFLIPFFVTN